MKLPHARRIALAGHLIDTGLLSRCFGAVIEGGGAYEILRFDVGRNRRETSSAELLVRAPTAALLLRIVDNLVALGGRSLVERPAELAPVERDGVAPERFHATTHHPTEVRAGGRWVPVAGQRMDAVIVVKGLRARCTLIRDLVRGDRVVVGVEGVRALPPVVERKAEHFAFMRSEASSERALAVKAREVAALVKKAKREGRRVVAVPGPVVVHTGGSDALIRLIRRGWVDALLSGNALAVHDVEQALFGTSLGVDVRKGVVAAEGHMHHLRAINAIRRAGSLAAAVRKRVLRSGIFHACVKGRVPFVLAGSIRDDGPLPDTEMDLVKAQRRYAEQLAGAGVVIVLASMLHGIGVGNMTPSDVTIVCVDIHGGVVTKLADRGSAHAIGIVTDVSAFLGRLESELRGRAPRKVLR